VSKKQGGEKMTRKWCKTLESEHGINYFKLLVPEEKFNENVIWYVGWAVSYGASMRVEKWYGMKDGTVIQIGRLAYSLDSWCSEFDYENGITKLLESLKSDLRRYKPTIYIAGSIPNEIKTKLSKGLSKELVIETQLPQ
jgi:hypothetical protein